MKKLNFPEIDAVDFNNLKKMGRGRMKSVKGGYTANTLTIPGGTDDGDDGIKND
ncbi:hypothetical protein [Sphingobacterium sp. JB170]|uniref:hypothetical protein n=1 Tax=Sphingobacterium sp. JB170 TaxID=1434842 RepID=UPI00097F5D52|nr:hypothetical protein [Sphingobacterium sp. JB170]SJN49812.1 hypothetical protein FM107_19265 [Sphingobacterium sp. JB170]